jgi:hypothetical protein
MNIQEQNIVTAADSCWPNRALQPSICPWLTARRCTWAARLTLAACFLTRAALLFVARW